MYTVRLPNFEGPLELLLYFVKRDELDIYDIPIARITEEFLAYVRLMQLLDLELAGEFLVMAATLMQIKARMLLPRPEQADGTESAEDPRTELVQQLIEYSRYRDVAAELGERYEQQRYIYYRRMLAAQPLPAEVTYRNATLFNLLEALYRVLRLHVEQSQATFVQLEREQYDVGEQMTLVLATLAEQPRCSFRELVRGRSRPYIVATFLAVLELCKNGSISLRQHEGDSDIIIEAPSADHPADEHAEHVPLPAENT
jgi:segregation and condensation protein A